MWQLFLCEKKKCNFWVSWPIKTEKKESLYKFWIQIKEKYYEKLKK
jgi:hypothetical protein